MRQFLEHLVLFQIAASSYSGIRRVKDKKKRVAIYAAVFFAIWLFQTACYIWCKCPSLTE
jgi:hypothetical protein